MTTDNVAKVAGLFATRVSSDTGQKEVFLVRGAHGAWHFLGGHVNPEELGFNDFLTHALRREIKEEIGIDFMGNVIEIDSGIYSISGEKLEIHTYRSDTVLDTSKAFLQDDREVTAFEWTNTPFNLSDGTSRPVTEHTRHIINTFFFQA